MRSLESEDMNWCVKRLPNEVRELLICNPEKLFLAGGFIRACIAREEINDIDLFSPSREKAKIAAEAMGKDRKLYETENAFSVIGLSVPVQFIHRWVFDEPAKCVESFDFTIARAAIWVNDRGNFMSCCDDRFYSDLAGKRLVYKCPVRNEDAGGSMLRVLKFYQRGYRIPLDSLGAVMARMFVAIDQEKVEGVEGVSQMTTEERTAFVLTGLLREVDPNTPLQ